MLDRLKTSPGSRHRVKRVGRGAGSGLGKTCGRGQKGAGSRSGSKRRPWYEGGQTPLARRIPKRGFRPLFRDPPEVVNVKDLNRFEAGAVIDGAALAEAGLVRRGDSRVKLLGEGEIGVPITARVHAVSGTARKKLEAAGGSIDLLAVAARGPKGGASA